jgi:hypothetical protein
MTIVAVVAVVIATAWLCVLTVAVMLCIRQLGALTVRLDLVARGGGGYAHGASVGFRLHESLGDLYAPLVSGRRIVLLVSATCTTCAKLIDELVDRGLPQALTLADGLIVLVGGRDQELARPVIDALSRIGTVIAEPMTTEIARGLRLANVPSALLLENGLITGSLQFVDHVYQIEELVAGAFERQPIVKYNEPALAD